MKYYDFDSWFKASGYSKTMPENREILMQAWEAGWQVGCEYGTTEEAISQADMGD